MATSRLGIVTATTNGTKAAACMDSWGDLPLVCVENGMGRLPYMGTVPAFRFGVDRMLAEYPKVEVIACLHDDVEIQDPDWAAKVLRHFDREPHCGLAGFGGAIGLGSDDLYQVPYNPMQLARQGFRSNMPDAEAHGARSLLAERVACLDGFSQIGRREFWEGDTGPIVSEVNFIDASATPFPRPWTYLESLGMIHHFYDGCLGCLARRAGWEAWYLPIRCTHYGGRTAVGDAGYQEWAKTQVDGGDHGFWEQAHRIGYDSFRDVLPLRV